jgi:hypothetical protein
MMNGVLSVVTEPVVAVIVVSVLVVLLLTEVALLSVSLAVLVKLTDVAVVTVYRTFVHDWVTLPSSRRSSTVPLHQVQQKFPEKEHRQLAW